MKIHCISVVKNEADILKQTLRAAANWCDWIYVLDNGSTDGTWEVVRELSRVDQRIVPYKRDLRPFDDGIREDVFRNFGSNASKGDWWCILDADEFYIDDPRSFLGSVPDKYKSVWMKIYAYLFTDADLIAYRDDPGLHSDEIPIEKRLHHYVIGEYAGMRFFRHSTNLRDLASKDIHPIYPKRIRMKHFAYRTPKQIQLRLDTRREPMQRGDFVHEKRANWVTGATLVIGPASRDEIPQSWEERVTPSSECRVDSGGELPDEEDCWRPPRAPSLMATLRFRARRLMRRAWHAKGKIGRVKGPGRR